MVLAEGSSSSSQPQQQQSPQISGTDTVSGSSASSNESVEGRESGSHNGSSSRRHTVGEGSTSTPSVRDGPRRLTSLDQQSGIRYIPLGIRHDSFEVERHQRLLKTKFCRFGPNCEFARKGQCFFVHAPQELKYRPPRPDGYPVRDRVGGYDDYDNYYYGDGEYYPNGQYYGNPSAETEIAEGYQQQQGGYEYQTAEAEVGRKNFSTEPALVAMELAVQIRDFVTTQDRRQLLVQAMNVLASSEAAEGDKPFAGELANVALTLATSLGGSPATSSTMTEVTPEKENKHHSPEPLSGGGYPIKLEDHIAQTGNFDKLDDISIGEVQTENGVTTAEMPANSCAQQ